MMRSSGRVTDRRKTVRGKRRKERVKKTREGKGTEKGSGGVRVRGDVGAVNGRNASHGGKRLPVSHFP